MSQVNSDILNKAGTTLEVPLIESTKVDLENQENPCRPEELCPVPVAEQYMQDEGSLCEVHVEPQTRETVSTTSKDHEVPTDQKLQQCPGLHDAVTICVCCLAKEHGEHPVDPLKENESLSPQGKDVLSRQDLLSVSDLYLLQVEKAGKKTDKDLLNEVTPFLVFKSFIHSGFYHGAAELAEIRKSKNRFFNQNWRIHCDRLLIMQTIFLFCLLETVVFFSFW